MHVIYNQGDQTIAHVPMAADGRVTLVDQNSQTYTILDLRNTDDDGVPLVLVASTAATVDSASTTTDEAAGPSQEDPRRIPVTNSANFVEGHTYIISDDGQRESFVAHATDTGVIYAATDLRHNWTSGATVRGIELRGTFPEDTADSEAELANGAGPFLVVWSYALNGTDYHVPQTVWLTRYSMAPLCTEADVIAARPDMSRRARGQSGISVSAAIRVAMQDYVAEVESAGKDPRYFVTASAGKNAVRERALQYLTEWMSTGEDDERALRHESRYQALMRSLLNGRPDHGTVEIKPSTNTAPPGPSRISGSKFFTRT